MLWAICGSDIKIMVVRLLFIKWGSLIINWRGDLKRVGLQVSVCCGDALWPLVQTHWCGGIDPWGSLATSLIGVSVTGDVLAI